MTERQWMAGKFRKRKKEETQIIDFKKQGKKNRQKGSDWEKIVRKDLESKGWVISKWQNQVEFRTYTEPVNNMILINEGRMIPCRMNFRGKGIPMMLGAGFPDFVAFKNHTDQSDCGGPCFEVIGVECKINGYLNPEEREKCNWMLTNNIFGKILIAFKNKEGKIEYKEYET